MISLACLSFACAPSHEIMWNCQLGQWHMVAQNVSDFGAFQILEFQINHARPILEQGLC